MTKAGEKGYEREFYISEIFSISWEVYRQNYRSLFPLAFIVYLPLNIFLAFFPITSLSEFDPADYQSWFRIFGAMNIAVYLSFIGNIAVAIALKRKLYTNNFSLGAVIGEIFKRYFNYFTTNTLMLVLVFVCFNIWMYFSITFPTIFLLLLIPIILYLVYWSFAIYIFSFKDINLYQSMRQSYAIVNGRWAKVFYYVASFILFSVITTLILGFPYSFLHDSIFVKILYTNLVSVITSFFVVAFIIFYVNFDDTKI
ncbi:MAG: hypothetical protein KIT33_00905 [Candidatus Kapabacteria bacterium]|nr:hypothetical protein [Ignavibacteriota bacterium]MCW5883506.1 hypothetical protein [Candidatus Kapabacteria bacterium]